MGKVIEDAKHRRLYSQWRNMMASISDSWDKALRGRSVDNLVKLLIIHNTNTSVHRTRDHCDRLKAKIYQYLREQGADIETIKSLYG